MTDEHELRRIRITVDYLAYFIYLNAFLYWLIQTMRLLA